MKVPPSLDPNFEWESTGSPKQADLGIFLYADVLRDVWNYSRSDLQREVGGVLIGTRHEYTNKPYIEVIGFIPATHGDSSSTTFTFTHDAWREINRIKDEKWPDTDMVGWHHTHPGLGVFLSKPDMFIHESFFNLPWMVALVVDPRINSMGFFHWKDGQIAPAGFYVVKKRT